LDKLEEAIKITNGKAQKLEEAIKITNGKLTKLESTVSTISCPKDCTREGCPLNHGGLTDLQDAALKKKEKQERDLLKARAKIASEARAEKKIIEENRRNTQLANLQKAIQAINDEAQRSREEEAKYASAEATANGERTEKPTRDVRDVNGSRLKDGSQLPKPELEAPAEGVEPKAEEGEVLTEEAERLEHKAAEDIVDEIDKKEARVTKRSFKKDKKKEKSSKNPKGKEQKNPAAPSVPPRPAKLTTGEKAEPATASPNVLMHLETQT
jgi:hypothetical protein